MLDDAAAASAASPAKNGELADGGSGSGWERRGAPGVGGHERSPGGPRLADVLACGVTGSVISGRGAVPALCNVSFISLTFTKNMAGNA